MEKIERHKLKHDGLVDVVSRTSLHLQQYRKVYLSLAALLVIAVIALGVILYQRSRGNEQAALLLSQARTVAALEEICNNYGGSESAPLALLFLADFLYRKGEFNQAGARYRLFLEKYSQHAFAPFAQMGIGYCQESLGNMEEAINQYRRLGEKFGESSLVPEAIFNVARCQLQLGRREEAIGAYEEIINLHPRSIFTRLAREQMVKLGAPVPAALF